MPEIERKDHRLHESQPTHRIADSSRRADVMFVHGVGGPVPGWDAALATGLERVGVDAGTLLLTTITYTEVFEAAGGDARGQGPDPAQVPDPQSVPDLLQLRARVPAGPTAQVLANQSLLESVAAHAARGPDGTDGAGRLRPPKIMPSEVVARLPLPGMWHAVAYRNRSEIRDAARRKVAGRIAGAHGGPRIVIAHSLGSMVVLDALHTFDFSIDLLITVGSPLGIDDGRTYEWDPKQDFPATQIGGWLNVVNTRDPVPWGRGAAARFPQAVDAFISAGSRLSGPGGVHDPSVYTGSSVVARAIAASCGA